MVDSKKLISLVEKYEKLIYDTADHIWAHPETGFREWKTSAYMEQHFEELGYTLTKAGNIPGFYTDLDTGKPGPKIAILGELDSLIVANHPCCDPETHYVHACGHHAQCAVLLGTAAALKEPGALDGLCGSIRFISVPAEELIELGYRESLRKQGIIKYFGGKVEFIHRGYFDGVDMAMMIHLYDQNLIYCTLNGLASYLYTFHGKAAHASAAPWEGVNALNAAQLMFHGTDCLRQHVTPDVRIHGVIRNGGEAPNIVPEEASAEFYVRALDLDYMMEIGFSKVFALPDISEISRTSMERELNKLTPQFLVGGEK